MRGQRIIERSLKKIMIWPKDKSFLTKLTGEKSPEYVGVGSVFESKKEFAFIDGTGNLHILKKNRQNREFIRDALLLGISDSELNKQPYEGIKVLPTIKTEDELKVKASIAKAQSILGKSFESSETEKFWYEAAVNLMTSVIYYLITEKNIKSAVFCSVDDIYNEVYNVEEYAAGVNRERFVDDPAHIYLDRYMTQSVEMRKMTAERVRNLLLNYKQESIA